MKITDYLLTIHTFVLLYVSGQWTTWVRTVTGPCSVTCGKRTGYQFVTLTRRCPPINNQQPRCRGNSSYNTLVECFSKHKCPPPVNGGWSTWAVVGTGGCSITCGDGLGILQIRKKRSCDKPRPIDGGRKCEGKSTMQMTDTCTAPVCPVDGQWSAWVIKIGLCTPKCYRQENGTRRCTNPPPSHGGGDCMGVSEYTIERECVVGNCSRQITEQNPQNSSESDGQWSMWRVKHVGPCLSDCKRSVSMKRICIRPGTCAGSTSNSSVEACFEGLCAQAVKEEKVYDPALAAVATIGCVFTLIIVLFCVVRIKQRRKHKRRQNKALKLEVTNYRRRYGELNKF